MKEEELLLGKFGRENPFRVPDNYFDSFAQHIMDTLPSETPCMSVEAERRSIFLRLLKPLSVAACACAVLLGGIAFMSDSKGDGEERFASYGSQYNNADYAVDQMADYAMLSNEDMYSYLLDE